MSDVTSQTLTELVKNIKEKKISSEETTKAFIERGENSKVFKFIYNWGLLLLL